MSELQAEINKIIDKIIPCELFKEAAVLSKLVKNTFNIYCPKCKSDNIYESTAQTRSADEAETKFFRCLNCGNAWRKG